MLERDAAGDLDVAVIGSYGEVPTLPAWLTATRLLRDPLALCLPSDHRMAATPVVSGPRLHRELWAVHARATRLTPLVVEFVDVVAAQVCGELTDRWADAPLAEVVAPSREVSPQVRREAASRPRTVWSTGLLLVRDVPAGTSLLTTTRATRWPSRASTTCSISELPSSVTGSKTKVQA